MRRFTFAFLAVPLALVMGIGPVAADTTGGGPGTSFNSFSERCSTKGPVTTCTDTNLFAFADASGSIVCLDIFTFAQDSRGHFVFRSDKSGCTSGATFTVGAGNAVTVAPTTVVLVKCGRQRCVHPTSYTVSASDTRSGPTTTTTTVSTSTDGTCTTIATMVDVFTPLSGTMTVNGKSMSEDGGLDVSTQDFSSTC
jgi:hypothetical protein